MLPMSAPVMGGMLSFQPVDRSQAEKEIEALFDRIFGLKKACIRYQVLYCSAVRGYYLSLSSVTVQYTS